jgi:HrpA-like RNA helicase
MFSRGYIDTEDKIMPAGKSAVRLPLDDFLYDQAIRLASENNCMFEMMTIVAVLNTHQEVFECPYEYNKRKAAIVCHAAFSNPVSDHMMLLNVVYSYEHVKAPMLAKLDEI